jgi:signal transduction histidine kinase
MREGLRLGSAVGYLAAGAVVLVFAIGGLGPAPSAFTLVFGGLLPTALVLALVVSGLWLAFRSDLTAPEFRRIAGWSLAGSLTVGGFAAVVVVAVDGQYELLRGELLVAETVVGGALAGLGIGLYDVLSQRQRARLEAERERLDVLNRMLRHHLLNGMNIILASAEELERRAETPERELRTIRRRGDEVVGLVERVSDLTDRIHEQPEPKPRRLCTLVKEAVGRAQGVYGTENVTVEEPVPDLSVLGDDTLTEAVETVVFERAQVSDAVVVGGHVTPEDVVLSVRDDDGGSSTAADGGAASGWGRRFVSGPVVDAEADEDAAGSERYAASLHQGVDIYMAELLLSRSGGRLEVVPGESTAVELYLPRA